MLGCSTNSTRSAASVAVRCSWITSWPVNITSNNGHHLRVSMSFAWTRWTSLSNNSKTYFITSSYSYETYILILMSPFLSSDLQNVLHTVVEHNCTVLAISNCVGHDSTCYAVLKCVDVAFWCATCRCDPGTQCWVHRVNVQAAHFLQEHHWDHFEASVTC